MVTPVRNYDLIESKNDISNGVNYAAYLLLGEEEFLKQETRERIKAALFDKKVKGFNCDIFSAKDTRVEEIIACALTVPFMAKKRLIVIKDIDRFAPADRERLIFYLRNPAKFSCLLLETDKTGLKDSFLSAVSQCAKVVFCKRLYANEVPAWISERARERSKLIRAAAIEILRERVGSELSLLASAMEILSLYAGERKEITREDVEEVVGKSVLNTTFELTDALGRKEAREAMGILGVLFRDGSKPTQILGMIAWQLKRLWRARELLQCGAGKEEVSRELRIHKFFLPKFLAQVENFSLSEREETLRTLLKADFDIKTGRKKAETALELLLLELCNSSPLVS